MFPYLAVLGLAGLLQWGVGQVRARTARRTGEGLIPGTVVSVTRRTGPAFGEPSRWDRVVVRYLDDAGGEQTLTHDAPGTGLWRPKVGATVHLYRGAVWPGRVFTNRLGDPAGEPIAEAEAHVTRVMQLLVYAIVLGTVGWAVVAAIAGRTS